MKIIDISREIFSTPVYPGDPVPQKRLVSSMEKGASYNLSLLTMGVHNATHVDAPKHFLADGSTVEQLPLEAVVGEVFVAEHEGEVKERDAWEILRKAKAISNECAKRLLIKGEATVTEEAASVFAKEGLLLVGNESQSVGPLLSPMRVHKILLSAQTVLLEGVDLREAREGRFLLSAAPILLAGCEGAPCRALLLDVF